MRALRPRTVCRAVWGCIYAAATPIVLEREVRLYYGASDGTHNGFRRGFLALATLRPDGFAGWEPEDASRPATVVTRPIEVGGDTLRLTTDVEAGSVAVTLLDAARDVALATAKPITRSVTATPVELRGGTRLSALRGRRVRLKLELRRAKAYSFAFTGG